MTDEIMEAQEDIITITKEKRGFLKPTTQELCEEAGIRWE